MNMCETVSNRMPAVASERSEWTADERTHLASCRDCMTEWKLVSLAMTLGRDVTVDAPSIAPRVMEQLRAAKLEDQRNRWMKKAAVLGTLAIAALLLLVMLPRPAQVVPVQPGAHVAAGERNDLQLAELDDAAPAELEMVLVEFDGPAATASSLDGPDLEGLDQSQVERALRSWEES